MLRPQGGETMPFVWWISRAYRSRLNKLARRSPEWVSLGCFVLVAIFLGGAAAAGAVSSSFGELAERTCRGAIYQPAHDSIDVTVIDPLPDASAIPPVWRFDMFPPERQLLMLASSASSVDALTNIDTLTDIDTLTT